MNLLNESDLREGRDCHMGRFSRPPVVKSVRYSRIQSIVVLVKGRQWIESHTTLEG